MGLLLLSQPAAALVGTTVRWIDVMGLQSDPIDLGLDASARAQFGVNIRATKVPSDTFDEEIEEVLIDAGIDPDTIFVSSKSVVPTGDGPYLSILLTGGTGIRTHNIRTRFAYVQATAQLVARGMVAEEAEALVRRALAILLAVKNADVAV